MTELRSGQFMGSTEIPLSAEEYRKRYQPDDVPHVSVRNPNVTGSIRVDVIAYRGGLVVSVLLLPGEICNFPTLEKITFQFVPHAYVHASTNP